MTNALAGHEAAQIASISSAIARMREAVAELEDARAALIRRADREGTLSRTEMVQAANVTRGRIWQIINPPEFHAEIDGQLVIEPDWEAIQLADDLWSYAFHEWENHDCAGEPDDYFPLEHVVQRDAA